MHHVLVRNHIKSVADPGFPVGGAPTRWGGADLRHECFSAKTHAKTKELDPVGARAPGAPPGSANANQLGLMCSNT